MVGEADDLGSGEIAAVQWIWVALRVKLKYDQLVQEGHIKPNPHPLPSTDLETSKKRIGAQLDRIEALSSIHHLEVRVGPLRGELKESGAKTDMVKLELAVVDRLRKFLNRVGRLQTSHGGR